MAFSAPFDRTTKLISIVVCLGLLAIVIFVHNPILDILSLLVLLIASAYSPRRYALEGQYVVVKRLSGAARIPLSDVREARKATGDDLRGCIRLWGSGGLFGYYGLFSTPKLGKSTWYVTDRSRAVVLITAAKTVLLSPGDTDGFLAAIRAAAPQTAAPLPVGAFRAPASSSSGKLIGIGIALAVLALVAAAMLYSPGPPGYTLTTDTLTIHDRFYPVTLHASAVDLNGIRIVDLNQNTAWRPVKRTNGFANSHYQSGWFQVANGDKVRLYRAGGSLVVLLPPKGAGSAVLYQAEAPAAFVGELRTEWGWTTRAAANAGK